MKREFDDSERLQDVADDLPEEPAVSSIVNDLEKNLDDRRTTLGDVIEAFGQRSFLATMLVPALIAFSPLSGIPMLSTMLGLAIALSAAQMLIGRDHLWLPRLIKRVPLGETANGRAMGAVEKVANWLDRYSRSRFSRFTSGPFRKVSVAICLVCGSLMPLLELVPFSSSLLGLIVLLLSVGLLARDGLFVFLGMLAAAIVFTLPISTMAIVLV